MNKGHFYVSYIVKSNEDQRVDAIFSPITSLAVWEVPQNNLPLTKLTTTSTKLCTDSVHD